MQDLRGAASRYLDRLGTLDPRSLACFRALVAAVVLYDAWSSWELLAVWPGLHGFYDGLPLPAPAGPGSEEWTLRLLLGLWALAALGLLAGFRTRLCTLGVWLGTCGHQFAASYTSDFHDTALCNMLLLAQALHLGRRFSLDARRARTPPAPDRAERLGGAAFVVFFAYIYLDAALQKTGPAWWSEGTAVWFALKDIEAAAAPGLWAAAHLPFWALRVLTHLSWGIEAATPFLLLSPWHPRRSRLLACALLAALHLGTWVLMDLGPFPPTMLAGILALLPAGFWGGPVAPQRVRPLGRVRGALWLAGAAAAAVVCVEGNRLRYREEADWPYPGAEWVARLRYFFDLESRWAMYAPQPRAHTGWWVGIGRTRGGAEIDPITGRAPTLARPVWGTPPLAGKQGYYWSAPPRPGGSPQDSYLRYLLWLDGQQEDPDGRLTHLVLLYMYEPLWPPRAAPHPARPLVVCIWPEDGTARPPLSPGSVLAGLGLYAMDDEQLGEKDWEPAPLPPRRTY